MVKKLVLSLIAVVSVCMLSFAQNKQVSGTVVDTDGLPVIGATIMVDGTTTGTSSGVDGSFTLPAPANGTLVVSYIGYQTQTIPVANRTHIDVRLEGDATSIDNVVVVGYGSGSKVGTAIGSSVKVKGEALENKPTANVADALQGKVAGLQVYTSSGEPTATSSMRLHGVGSLTAGSSPLVVLDGVPISMEAMLSLNSNDIESMTMLKDASATSIYGSRAANGVLYITLKKGRRGEQARVVVNALYGISQPATGKYEVMNTAQLAAYELENGFISEATYEDRIKSGIDTNWRKFYYRDNAPVYQADISVTGGTENTAYYIAGGYMNQEGTAPHSSLSKYTFRTTVDSSVASWLRVGSNVTLGYDERTTANSISNSVYNAAFISLLSRPDTNPYNEDGTEKEKIDNYYNPNYLASKTPSVGRKMQINANAYVQITPVENLNIKSLVGVDGTWFTSKGGHLPSYAAQLGNGDVTRSHQDFQTVSITNTIDYNFSFSNPDHRLYLLAGQEGIKFSETQFTAMRAGQIRDDLFMLSNGIGTPSVTDAFNSYLFNSWFGRAEYSYAGKYTADATVRRDASSRFGSANRSAVFYSFGLMWNAKRERFLYNNQTISDLSFKVSYGTQGNASLPSNYAYWSTVNTATYNDQTALYLGALGNEHLGWETQKLLTVAANISLWNRLDLEVEFYNRITDDMLMSVPMPATSGFLSRYENVGSMRNRGVDLTLNADIVRTKDWLVNFHATFSYGRSIVTKLFHDYDEYAMPSMGLCYRVGKDAGSFYLPVFKGVNPDTGVQIWETVNEDGTKGETEDFNQATMQLLDKSRYAPYSGGFGINASWKGITLNADFSWNYGKYLVNNALVFLEDPSFAGSFNRTTNLMNAWKKPGDITDVPKFGEVCQFDTHLLEDASFLRLKNLTIGYDLPKTLLAKTGVLSGIRVYFTARNLFTCTGFTGYDPEIDSNLALGNYPNSRQFVGGIQVTF